MLLKPLKKVFTEDQIIFVIVYFVAFVVDNFVKISVIKYGYKTAIWVASKTKISPPMK